MKAAGGTRGNAGSVCPSCDRYIGPADTCPYCDADSAKPPVLRVLRYGAILVATLGLALLYVAALHRDLPIVRVKDITPMMNYGYVRLAGRVLREPYSSQEGRRTTYASFLLGDGSGEIRVVAYEDVAAGLADGPGLPQKGDAVEVSGSLNVTAEGATKLRLQSARDLRVTARSRAAAGREASPTPAPRPE